MASRLIIDRIENGVAACETENRAMKLIPVSALPEGAKEGDVLYERDGRYSTDVSETSRLREENIRLMKMLGLKRAPEDGKKVESKGKKAELGE